MSPQEHPRPSSACIWCGGPLDGRPLLTTTDRLRLSPGVFRFYSCQRCASAVLDPQPDADEAAGQYESGYHLPSVPSGTGLTRLLEELQWRVFYRRWHRKDVQHIRRFVGAGPVRLLDVGCGPGTKLNVFQAEGFNVQGLELSEQFSRHAVETLGLPVRRVRLESLDPAQEQFDVITMYSVLEHIPEPRRFLRAALRLLRPGGLLVVRVPIREALLTRLLRGRHIAYREVPRHIWIPSCHGLIRGVEEEGADCVWQAPTGLLPAASLFALSVHPHMSPAASRGSLPALVAWRLAAAALVCVGLPVALWECLEKRTGETDFFFTRRPGR